MFMGILFYYVKFILFVQKHNAYLYRVKNTIYLYLALF